jgi:hypothetical protein
VNKTERKQLVDSSDSAFEKAWTKAAKDLEEAKERCALFAEINRERQARAKIEAMDPAERAELAQFVGTNGIDASGPVNGDNRG